MSRKRKNNRLPTHNPANPRINAPAQSTPDDQPAQSGTVRLFLVVVLLVFIALALWAGNDLYPIVFKGEICRPRYRCESWSSNPVSLGVQCLGFTLLMTSFMGVAYGALKMLLGRASDEK
jgi:hypothetical protein